MEYYNFNLSQEENRILKKQIEVEYREILEKSKLESNTDKKYDCIPNNPQEAIVCVFVNSSDI